MVGVHTYRTRRLKANTVANIYFPIGHNRGSFIEAKPKLKILTKSYLRVYTSTYHRLISIIYDYLQIKFKYYISSLINSQSFRDAIYLSIIITFVTWF